MKWWLQWDCCLFHVPFSCWILWGSELTATFWTSHSMTHRSPPWHFPALNPAAETKTSDIDSTSFQVITYHHIIHRDVQVILKNGLIWKFLELQTKRWWNKTPSKETPFFSSPCVLRNGHAGRLRTCHQSYRLLQLLGTLVEDSKNPFVEKQNEEVSLSKPSSKATQVRFEKKVIDIDFCNSLLKLFNLDFLDVK